MRDRHQLEEVTGAVSLGLLAEELVLATGRALRREKLGDRDLKTLDIGRQLLETLSATAIEVVPPRGPSRMSTDAAYLDAFKAARLQAPGEPVQQYLSKLAAALTRLVEGEEPDDSDRELISEIRDLFARLGDVTLARANDLFDRKSEEPFKWIRMRATSLS